MTNISWNEIADRATEFASKWQGETYEKGESQSFWGDFLNIYGVDRRRHGAFFEYAIKKGNGKQGFIDMFWPGQLLAEQKSGGKDLTKAGIQAYEYLETMPDHDLPHAIVLSDFASFVFLLNDGTKQKVEFTLADLPKNVKLFGFLINQQSKRLAEEHPVNRKAAEAMAKLHNQLHDDNYTGHDLELLLVRLVFCMFADDSGIFDQNVMLEYLQNRTNDDGSDLGSRLVDIFQTIDTPLQNRQTSLDEAIASLPYVNGGLFAESIRTPHFSGAMRRVLLTAMQLDWSKVSPAIFGSMFQGVMDDQQRRDLGAHYTSEKNILRVIKPLFLDDLYSEFALALAAGPRKKFDELEKFHAKLANLRFLDPACGSGNFLIIAYRELRRLEHKVIDAKRKGDQTIDWLATSDHGSVRIDVDQMYGIEYEEFPSMIARAALWLTDHQMNMEFSKQSGSMFKRLPLTASANITHGNALMTDWADVVDPQKLDYILGNPPFLGQTYQSSQQKQEVAAVLKDIKKTGVLDYVSAWYGKSAQMMKLNTKIQTALVSTNSITQGEQVSILWKYMLDQGVKINFAHRTFKWANDAKGVAAVHCVIIGFALFNKSEKKIFDYPNITDEPIDGTVKNINPYLVDAVGVVIENRNTPLSDAPKMIWGNKPTDGGNFLLNKDEYELVSKSDPYASKYIKRYIGGGDFLNNNIRYCLWLKDASPNDIRSSDFLRSRINSVGIFRRLSKAETTQAFSDYPTLFRQISQPLTGNYLAIPEVSSERRNYIPLAFFDYQVIASNTVQLIPNATNYDFGILTSRMHMAWMRAVAGRLKSDYRYSKDIVYNNFIWPDATEDQKAEISKLAKNILDARAEFPDTSLADLYDPLTMPPSLSHAHKTLDRAVDRLYRPIPFVGDAERVALLFQRYREIDN
ncbi:hypothetical protein A2707_06010 [Candidatus Saccharibacteria bacterium RIFCSPHIGHO2_01_FULL_45_15]|nr:MAG: hypothetical protein A2707_06010 [Candidatus Saccharibacteria bacterium RIFCSPHIGHO2_01_FULL_45_15]OGL28999.1 MAG: hypothetical protein A3C39_06235 [Candidatus Saccharibacteria bacterium RIFCSPHIGHO2_02_FULL_46_12]OGL32014.1 MAG: hypothetical protein A3E76_01955 [Candidatus Saccharibacteria bacterium RIFCSPHIGHO2_12_FULL_44_22]